MKIETLTEEDFKRRIIGDWAHYFNSNPEELSKPGSHYIKRDSLSDGRVIISHVGSRTFVQYGPDSEDKILSFGKLCPNDQVVTADHLVSYFGNENIHINCLDKLMYLYPANLKIFTPDTGVVVRKLQEEDQKYINELNNSCTKEEVDNTFLALDEVGAWGCFIDNRLVSAVSYADWGLYGDFGVLTHPEYRGQGLAKAVLSAGCKEAIFIGKIPIYRCHITLFSSINTAKPVGFSEYPTTYFKQEVLEFEPHSPQIT